MFQLADKVFNSLTVKTRCCSIQHWNPSSFCWLFVHHWESVGLLSTYKTLCSNSPKTLHDLTLKSLQIWPLIRRHFAIVLCGTVCISPTVALPSLLVVTGKVRYFSLKEKQFEHWPEGIAFCFIFKYRFVYGLKKWQ